MFFVEYAKASPEDILIKITACNRGAEQAELHLMPTLWFRNTWSWGRDGEDYWGKPKLSQVSQSEIRAEHESLGKYALSLEPALDGHFPELLFTENATNTMRLWGADSGERYVKDAFHRYVINRERGAVNPDMWNIPCGSNIRLRNSCQVPRPLEWL
jgi:hypothetical protein